MIRLYGLSSERVVSQVDRARNLMLVRRLHRDTLLTLIKQIGPILRLVLLDVLFELLRLGALLEVLGGLDLLGAPLARVKAVALGVEFGVTIRTNHNPRFAVVLIEAQIDIIHQQSAVHL